MVDRYTVTTGKHFFEGVQRARADIAVNHPDRRDQHTDRLRRRMLGTRRLTTCLTHPTLLLPRPDFLEEALCFVTQHALFYMTLQTFC
ncbi:hypothetical protein D3C84_1016510 [compost metagenome]